MKKYYITRTDLKTGKVTYRKNKTIDGWASEAFKPYCWRFSKQGAQGIVKRLTEHQHPSQRDRITYGIEPVED